MGRKKLEPGIIMSLRVKELRAKKVKALAAKFGISASAILNMALSEFLEKRDQEAKDGTPA